MPTLIDLLRLLHAATDKGMLYWTQTAEEDTFRTELANSGLVRVSKSGTAQYVLSVIDQDGVVLKTYLPYGEDEQTAIEALFNNARNRALNLDWKLNGFFDQLKSLVGEP